MSSTSPSGASQPVERGLRRRARRDRPAPGAALPTGSTSATARPSGSPFDVRAPARQDPPPVDGERAPSSPSHRESRGAACPRELTVVDGRTGRARRLRLARARGPSRAGAASAPGAITPPPAATTRGAAEAVRRLAVGPASSRRPDSRSGPAGRGPTVDRERLAVRARRVVGLGARSSSRPSQTSSTTRLRASAGQTPGTCTRAGRRRAVEPEQPERRRRCSRTAGEHRAPPGRGHARRTTAVHGEQRACGRRSPWRRELAPAAASTPSRSRAFLTRPY